MRLIDADAYSAEMKQRQEACKEWLSGLSDSELQNQAIGTLNAFIEAKLTLDSMPTVDAVEVIRCKDCIWNREKEWVDCYMSGMHGRNVNNFCSQGKRREE